MESSSGTCRGWFSEFNLFQEDSDRALLKQAIAEHNNLDIASFLDAVTYRDDIPLQTAGVLDRFSMADKQRALCTFKAGLSVIGLSSLDR